MESYFRTDGEIELAKNLELRRDHTVLPISTPVTPGPDILFTEYIQVMYFCAAMSEVFWPGILTGLTPTGYMPGTCNTPAEETWHSSLKSPAPGLLIVNDRAGW